MAAWITCLLLSFSAQAVSPLSETLAAADQAYQNYEFSRAAELYRKALSGGQVKNPQARAEARLHLSFSLFIAGRRAEAEVELRELLARQPEFTFERKGVHPDLLAFFDAERQSAKAKLAQTKPPAVSAPRAAPQAPARAPVLRWIPFVGHFANRDPVGGALWIGAEAAVLALHVTAIVLQERTHVVNRSAGQDYYADIGGATAFWWVRNVSAAALILIPAAAVVDALLWSPARGAARWRVAAAPMTQGAEIMAAVRF